MSRSLGIGPEVEAYVRAANPPEHPVLARCREATQGRDDAAMQISPEQAAFMTFLAGMIDARVHVDVGVFTGYSTVAMALALHGRHGNAARVLALDVSAEHLETAMGYAREAGVDGVVEPRAGDARATLEALRSEDLNGAVDTMFVDADKTGYAAYYEAGLELLRPGGLLLFDNVLWSGKVADPSVTDADTEALRAVTARARTDERLEVAFTTVGDGLLLCRKR